MGEARRGRDVEFHLRSGLTDENFVAEVIGNAAAFRLQRGREEPLTSLIVRVDVARSHHFRLVVGHPDRILDGGIGHDLPRLLNSLCNETTDGPPRTGGTSGSAPG